MNSAGIDTFVGGAGQDVYQFREVDSGFDAILFVDGEDKVDFSGRGLTFASLQITDTPYGATVMIGTHQIIFDKLAASALTSSDFIF